MATLVHKRCEFCKRPYSYKPRRGSPQYYCKPACGKAKRAIEALTIALEEVWADAPDMVVWWAIRSELWKLANGTKIGELPLHLRNRYKTGLAKRREKRLRDKAA